MNIGWQGGARVGWSLQGSRCFLKVEELHQEETETSETA